MFAHVHKARLSERAGQDRHAKIERRCPPARRGRRGESERHVSGRVGYNDPEVVRRIFDAIRAGEGPRQVAKRLNAECVTTITGSTWSGWAMRRGAMAPRHRGVLIPPDELDALDPDKTRELIVSMLDVKVMAAPVLSVSRAGIEQRRRMC